MTVRLGLLFSFLLLLPHFPCYYCTTGTLPSLLDTVFSWTYLPIPRLGQDALQTVHLFPYLLTCLTLTLTVPSTRTSVPADVHLLCPLCAHISSLLPYVSLHLPCMFPDPLTYVVPRPLYVFS